VQTYDDYPVMSVIQLEDLGFFCAKGEGPDFVRSHTFTNDGSFPVNNFGRPSSSSDRPVAAAGFLGPHRGHAPRSPALPLPEARCPDARVALVSGFGMINYDRGLCCVGRHSHGGTRGVTEPLSPPERKKTSSYNTGTGVAALRTQSAWPLGLTAAACLGRFELQVCRDCGDRAVSATRGVSFLFFSLQLDWTLQSGEGELIFTDDPGPQPRSVLPRTPAMATGHGPASIADRPL